MIWLVRREKTRKSRLKRDTLNWMNMKSWVKRKNGNSGRKQFSKCIKCYACSNICPLCFCDRCIVEKNQPQWIDPSAHPRGNLSWNVTRAYHLAGRCINCEECQRVCPVDIPLNLLNKKLAKEAEKSFNYRPGYNIDDELAMSTYKEDDEQGFFK